jgi:hypothetical protein
MSLRDSAYAWFYVMLAIGVLYWYIEHVKENAAVVHYWRGRKDGWDMHRRMMENKSDADKY